MICVECRNRKHRICDNRNKNKQGKDCDCQHKRNADVRRASAVVVTS